MDKIWEAPELNDLEVLDADTLSRVHERLLAAFAALALMRRGINPAVCGWPWRNWDDEDISDPS